jgi:hypothetical protein
VWLLGYPQAALADAYHALKGAREIAQAASLMFALGVTAVTCLYSGDCAAAKAHSDEAVALAEEKKRVSLESARNVGARFALCYDRQDLGCANNHLRGCCFAVKRI